MRILIMHRSFALVGGAERVLQKGIGRHRDRVGEVSAELIGETKADGGVLVGAGGQNGQQNGKDSDEP